METQTMTYAETKWTAEDVQTLRPKWTLEKCAEWLNQHEKYIQEAMTRAGWEAIEALL